MNRNMAILIKLNVRNIRSWRNLISHNAQILFHYYFRICTLNERFRSYRCIYVCRYICLCVHVNKYVYGYICAPQFHIFTIDQIHVCQHWFPVASPHMPYSNSNLLTHIGGYWKRRMTIYQHIEAETIWSTFHWRYFQTFFLNENVWILHKISRKLFLSVE